MPIIETDNILKLGRLARIGISNEAARDLAPQLSQILDYVAQLQQIETTGVEPTSQVTGLNDVWREDIVVEPQINQDTLFKNTPQTQDGYIKVRRVL